MGDFPIAISVVDPISIGGSALFVAHVIFSPPDEYVRLEKQKAEFQDYWALFYLREIPIFSQ